MAEGVVPPFVKKKQLISFEAGLPLFTRNTTVFYDTLVFFSSKKSHKRREGVGELILLQANKMSTGLLIKFFGGKTGGEDKNSLCTEMNWN